MAWKFNFSTIGKYPTTVHKFLMDYRRGGEGRSQAKRAVGGVGEAHGRGRRRSGRGRRCAPGPKAAACSDEALDGMLWAKRSWSRVKRLSSVKGEAIKATTCSGGEAVEGALRMRQYALGISSVEDQKRASGENLLSVEGATRAPDIYIEDQMHDAHSLRHVAHFFRRVALLFPMGNMWVPNGRCTLIRHVTLLFPMGNTWIPNGRHTVIRHNTL
jgi:hypothetical protein